MVGADAAAERYGGVGSLGYLHQLRDPRPHTKIVLLTSSSNQSLSDLRPYRIFLTFADCFFFCWSTKF